jgi:hypothetical protein
VFNHILGFIQIDAKIISEHADNEEWNDLIIVL